MATTRTTLAGFDAIDPEGKRMTFTLIENFNDQFEAQVTALSGFLLFHTWKPTEAEAREWLNGLWVTLRCKRYQMKFSVKSGPEQPTR